MAAESFAGGSHYNDTLPHHHGGPEGDPKDPPCGPSKRQSAPTIQSSFSSGGRLPNS